MGAAGFREWDLPRPGKAGLPALFKRGWDLSCHALRKAYMADHALRLYDAGASLNEIAREMGIEQKTAKGLISDAGYGRSKLAPQ